MIKSIQIENFKSIKNQSIELGKINILIGANGAGKSNFISLLEFLQALAKRELFEYIRKSGGIDTLLNVSNKGQSDTLKVLFGLDSPDDTLMKYEFEIGKKAESYVFTKQHIEASSDITWDQEFAEETTEASKFLFNMKETKSIFSNEIANWHSYHLKNIEGQNSPRNMCSLDDVFYLYPDGSNIAAILYLLQEKHFQVFNQIVELVRMVYPEFVSFHLVESPVAKGKIDIRWKEKNSSKIFSSSQMSDGMLRFITLVTVLLLPAELQGVSNLIIIDEPELGLHPFAISILAELIESVAHNRQIIIATQSVTFVDQFEPDDIIVVERNDKDGTVFRRKSTEAFRHWLDEYSTGELWEMNLLGGRP